MFKSRLISGVLLVIMAFLTVGSGGYVLAATLWLISIIAFHELCLACKIQKDAKKQNCTWKYVDKMLIWVIE